MERNWYFEVRFKTIKEFYEIIKKKLNIMIEFPEKTVFRNKGK